MYEPLGLEGQVAQGVTDELATWTEALQAYRRRDWDRAEQLLAELLQRQPDSKLYALYMERIAEWRTSPPPPDWAGVTKLDSK
jgi:adenylate cyclase